MQTDIDPRSLIGRRAFDRDGTKIGTVDEVYLDDATGAPEWAAVRTGMFTRDAFVPLEPSELVDDELRVPFKKSLIRDAPDFGVGRHLSPEQELQLYHHYDMDVPRSDGGLGPGPERDFGDLPDGGEGAAPPAGLG
ncbi:PRC-barrel domain-containing protein [Streptomyces sp. DvalAA-14]|uniref:PRC-barrel domain-containing protein n=1 Tax=unclassified Streptomyces TaxID=2593676 RepID=UPI00081BACFA|nr:PRC-barrel domain-containing protein [Streptomyces sp. DvalAA-14]MYS23242.1 PRC-barrel domain containing protein [Streptomyces sp. SID4948]SCE30068.1 PRC-barrel domain-containing protein [Streptomyces sp. DvalAA-14]